MLALKDFGLERWRKIEPYVASLPGDQAINLCAASGQLLDALTQQQQWGNNPDALARNRTTKCFPDEATFRATFTDPAAFQKLQQQLKIGITSRYFSLRTDVAIGASQFALYSLLLYEGSSAGGPARVRVVQRGFAQ
jgi:general secretion pathway protein K